LSETQFLQPYLQGSQTKFSSRKYPIKHLLQIVAVEQSIQYLEHIFPPMTSADMKAIKKMIKRLENII